MKIVHEWLSELVDMPAGIESVAREISLRGFEVASVEHGVIDFEITANRPDCLSHAGMAREASVIWPQPHRPERIAPPLSVGRTDTPSVVLEDADLCPRYCAQLFDVEVGPSPSWLVKRLEAAGVRSINNIVDVSNYVMLAIGQPMHAFDLERLSDRRLIVRRARPGETLRTLDGVNRALDTSMLVIADAERAVAIGGVMGGQDSEISAATTRIVLESAYFQPASIRRTSKKLNLKTEASIRFERGGDINAPLLGLSGAAALFERIGAGRPGELTDVHPAPRAPVQLALRAARIARVLGLAVPAAEVPRILGGLGFVVDEDDGNRWVVRVPSFRVDVTREVDLIEEVGRHYGFDRLPTTFPVLAHAPVAPDPGIERDRRVRAVLTASGLSESMTFAFIERDAARPFCAPGTEPAPIANPLSEKFAVLRPSLLPGLVDSCAHNRRRGRKDVRLFETGSRFTLAGEGRGVAVVWSGAGSAPHWSAATRPADFFDVKGVVDVICSTLDVRDLELAPVDAPFLVRGCAATVRSGGIALGVLGQLLPAIAESRGFPAGEALYVAELDMDALASRAAGGEVRAETPPKFPSIVRDVSILIGEALPAVAVRGTIRSAAPPFLQSIVEFDRYQGKGVPEGRVSLSLRLTFNSAARTLTDDEIEAAMSTIVAAIEREHEAQRR